MEETLRLLDTMNPLVECKRLRWRLWECPPFLFLVMGFVIIVAMVATNTVAGKYTDQPEYVALMVILVTVFLLIIGYFIVSGFNKIAEANRMKSEFISIISHQLRSPLSIFRWTLNAVDMAKDKDHLSANTQNLLHTLHSTTVEMIGLVNSLLDMTRIEASTFTLNISPFSLEQLTRDLLGEYEILATASNVRIVFEPAPNLPHVLADSDRTTMVVENLIDNALRYTPGGREIKISLKKEGNMLKWAVVDQGIGIPKGERKNIFGKFFRAGNARIRQTQGNGIGLYTAKAIIEFSGGKIGFQSEENKGSTFWFTLPAQ